jgi:hypothetical protein
MIASTPRNECRTVHTKEQAGGTDEAKMKQGLSRDPSGRKYGQEREWKYDRRKLRTLRYFEARMAPWPEDELNGDGLACTVDRYGQMDQYMKREADDDL